MSNKTLEFHFDFASPTTYLAYTQVPRIAQGTGATLVWHPMLLGGVFKATGNASPVSVPAKGRWMNDDIARWAKRWCVPFVFNPHFPINTLTLMRGACGLLMRQPADFRRYVDTVFHAMWVAPRNLGEPGELAAAGGGQLRRRGLHGPGGRRRSQGRPGGAHRGVGGTRRVRRTHLLRRQPDVLRPGPAGLRARSAGRRVMRWRA
jgi:2-hydroxychromene-2-carboxylate isomerase